MTYTTINTFNGGEYKRDVREDILNPLIVQHNEMGNHINRVDTKVDDLAGLIGDGGGGEVDLSGIISDIADLDSKTLEHSGDIEALEGKSIGIDEDIILLKNQLADAISRIITLENSKPEIPVDPNPKKFYVIPLFGQSNMVGYGEQPRANTLLGDIDSRIKQLSRSNSKINITSTGYGDRFDELRGDKTDCEIIPATPCLDHSENMITRYLENGSGGAGPGGKIGPGGTVGTGLYLAKLLLPHIPNDYGILLVPCAHGGKGFNDGWFGVNPTTAATQDMVDRVKKAMENPENKLLATIWTQGEMDAHLTKDNEYYNEFKNMYDWIKTQWSDLLPRTVNGYKWLCCGFTKYGLNAGSQLDYVNSDITVNTLMRSYLAVYDTFAYLGKSYPDEIYAMRQDIDDDGNFTETNLEAGDGTTSSMDAIHFSSKAFKEDLAIKQSNAIKTYVLGKPPVMHTRQIRGGLGSVTTDYVTYVYPDVVPAIGSATSNPSTLDSFAIKFNFKYTDEIRSDKANMFTSVTGLVFRVENGSLVISVGGKDLMLSKFFQGAWEGSYNDTQEIMLVYKDDVKQALLFVNDKLVESATGLSSVSLPSSFSIANVSIVTSCVSNLTIHPLL